MKALFDIPQRSTREQDSATLKKSKKKTTTTVRTSGGSLASKIEAIRAMVETHLGKYRDETLIIRDEKALETYIDWCIQEGICAIDTETTGLDPLQDDLVGIGIYTPGHKTCYIPVGHLSTVTGQKVKTQLPLEYVSKQLDRLNYTLAHPVDIDMFNAPFDIRMIKNHCGTRLHCTHDGYLGARLLNDNEPTNSLKPLHKKYVLRGEEDAFKFDELFKGVNFAYVPIDVGALYAAHDPKITFEYCEYQRQHLRLDHERQDMRDIAWVFYNIEMPCVDAVVDLEDTGVAFDFAYNDELKKKYHAILDEKLANFNKACAMYADEIALYDGKTRLDDPININSVPQLQALLYDIAKIEAPIDKKTKKPSRSTSEENLQKLKHPLADAILEYRSFATLVGTFIDKLPECVNPKDGRIHCKFNQYGADTGRFSSSDPNMQNIPSHNKDIRKMFKATDEEYNVEFPDDIIEVDRFTEIETPTGWKFSEKLQSGDLLLIVDEYGEAEYEVEEVTILDNKVRIRIYSPS